MPLAGQAALAMWWDMDPAMRAEFEDWHAHEHFPERLGLPGFLRASRWADAAGGEGFFVLDEVDHINALTSPEYPGVAGVHLLRAQRQAIAATTEHRIRGSADGVADQVVLLLGEDDAALAAAVDAAFTDPLVRAALVVGRYRLRQRATSARG